MVIKFAKAYGDDMIEDDSYDKHPKKNVSQNLTRILGIMTAILLTTSVLASIGLMTGNTNGLASLPQSLARIGTIPEASAAIGFDFKQCANKNPTLGNCVWINGILQKSNSQYNEGMSTPQKLLITGVTSGTHTIDIGYMYTKSPQGGGAAHHAYDFLTTLDPLTADNASPVNSNAFLQGVTDYAPYESSISNFDYCAGLSITVQACNSIVTTNNRVFAQIPHDTFTSKDGSQSTRETAFEGAFPFPGTSPQAARYLTIYSSGGGSSVSPTTLVVTHDVANGADTGDSNARLRLTYAGSSSCTVANPCTLLVFFGAHIAIGSGSGVSGQEWGTNLGASSVKGGPYHVKDIAFDGQGGSMDNQLKASDVLPPPPQGTIVIRKVTSPASDAQDFTFEHNFNDRFGSAITPTTFTLDTDGSDSTFSNQKSFSVGVGSYHVDETNIPDGWVLVDRACQTSGSSIAGPDGSNENRININVASEGDTITCTFTDNELGSLNWTKVDNAGQALAGATFQVCRTDVDPDDCVTVVDNGAIDEDFDAAEFGVSGLPLGTYTIKETVAPEGYSLDPDTVTVELSSTGDGVHVTIDEAFVDQRPILKITAFGYTNTNNTVPTSGVVNGNTTYTLKVKNLGGSDALLNVTLFTNIPDSSGLGGGDSFIYRGVVGLAATAESCAVDSDAIAGCTTEWKEVALAPGEEKTFAIKVSYNVPDGTEIFASGAAVYTTDAADDTLVRDASGSVAKVFFTVQDD